MNFLTKALQTKIGGQSTPMLPRVRSPRAKAVTKKTTSTFKGPTPPGSNAQSEAYGKAMRSAYRNTQTYGVPGAK